MMCVKAHELISKKTDYPLHVGITESGTIISGNIKSSIGLALILNQGIGDTIRVSLTGDPVEEIKSAKLILKTLGLRKGCIEIVSCPTCGRTSIDLISLANKVENMVAEYPTGYKSSRYGLRGKWTGRSKRSGSWYLRRQTGRADYPSWRSDKESSGGRIIRGTASGAH